MRVVIDTNVFISGIFFSGPPYEILNAWRRGLFKLIVSPEILAEYQETGEELATQIHGADLTPWIELLMSKATIIKALPLPTSVCTDPDDDMFLACALAGRAKIIVTGDKALLRVSRYEGIVVLTPRQFLTLHLM